MKCRHVDRHVSARCGFAKSSNAIWKSEFLVRTETFASVHCRKEKKTNKRRTRRKIRWWSWSRWWSWWWRRRKIRNILEHRLSCSFSVPTLCPRSFVEKKRHTEIDNITMSRKAPLVVVSLALSQTLAYTARPRIRPSASRGVPVYACAGTHCA